MNNKIHSLALLVNLGIYGVALSATTEDRTDSVAVSHEDIIVVTVAQQGLQAPGVPTITADETRKNLPARGVSEIIRTMPGVNLTGNSTSGQRGNDHQIDIHSMGPEDTLTLIDNGPVISRNSVYQGWHGERDTCGDTAWVTPEMVERTEVLRGPATTHYDNSTADGVVNIIAKRGGDERHGSWNAYLNAPGHKEEGSIRRTSFSLNGPLGGGFSFRLSGNLDKTQADAWDINDGRQSVRTGSYAGTMPAGRKGAKNKDTNGLLRWGLTSMQSLEFEAGHNRQGNLYAGDTRDTNNDNKTSGLVKKYYGKEISRVYRQSYALMWNGGWDSGITTSNWARYGRTRNSRLGEGLAGGLEGLFNSNQFTDTDLADVTLHSGVSIPFDLLVSQNLTPGTEWNWQCMKDMSSNVQIFMGGNIPGASNTDHSLYSQVEVLSLSIENNVELIDSIMLTSGLRFDHHSVVGDNWSLSLNLSQSLDDDFTLKMGITQAYKAPSLYQASPNYILYSKGQGCYATGPTMGIGCYMMNNDDLKAETSINKGIGLEFKRDGWLAGVTWFRNDYHDKIEAGTIPLSRTSTTQGNPTTGKETVTYTDIYQWENVPEVVAESLEGVSNVPVSETVAWANNITYMLQSKNKETDERLSVIPEYTLNLTLSWQAYEDLSLQPTFTRYGKQQPKKYDYQGKPVADSSAQEVSPYSIVGLSTAWDVTKNISLISGVDNVFDKHLRREGNAQTTNDIKTGGYMANAGAYTYDESGRTWYMSINTHS